MSKYESFQLSIELGNDAMRSGCDVAAALNQVAAKIKSGDREGRVRDVNGNTVGAFEFSKPAAKPCK